MRHILFELEGVLFVTAEMRSENNNTKYPPGSLTPTSDRISGKSVYMLNQQKMAAIFTKLVRSRNLRIGFLSSTFYAKEDVTKLLEKAYGLPRNILSSCFYYNANNLRGDRNMRKGFIMNGLRVMKIIKGDSILVDNSIEQIYEAQFYMFEALYINSLDSEAEYIENINNLLDRDKLSFINQLYLLKDRAVKLFIFSTTSNAKILPEPIEQQPQSNYFRKKKF